MNDIYLKIYMEDKDTIVFEGQGKEDKPGYYPTRWDDVAHRFGTVVVGKEHITKKCGKPTILMVGWIA